MTFFQTYRHILRRIYNTIGFTQGYNFVLWFILSGALVGFCLARIRYIDIDNVFCGKRGIALPGECYTLGHGRGKIGITLHLAGIIPAGFLVVLQFTPVIRHRWTMFHRINGYLIMLLAMISFAGVIIIGNIHFGGSLTTQVLTGAATLIFLTCLGLAFYHIKRLQIEQHRAWMLRAWVSASHVITMRIIAELIKRLAANQHYDSRPCAVIDYIYSHNSTIVASLYPPCAAFYTGTSPHQNVLVSANSFSPRPEEIGAGFTVTFGPAAFIALLVHCVGVEIYLHLTPGEAERLRRVSWQRQVEAGMIKPEDERFAQRLGEGDPWAFSGKGDDNGRGVVCEGSPRPESTSTESTQPVKFS